MMRNLASITYRSMGGKEDISNYWRLKRDVVDNEPVKAWTSDEIKSIEERANKIFSSGRLKS